LTIARGSLMELATQLIVGGNLQFLKPDELGLALKQVEDIGRMLNRLIAALRNRRGRA
jgi:four helix bundle protein